LVRAALASATQMSLALSLSASQRALAASYALLADALALSYAALSPAAGLAVATAKAPMPTASARITAGKSIVRIAGLLEEEEWNLELCAIGSEPSLGGLESGASERAGSPGEPLPTIGAGKEKAGACTGSSFARAMGARDQLR